jgi:hypothetical protein
MKNLHLIQTDKPSRLFKFANQLHLDNIPKDYYNKYQIYITSDEEIKEGDWFYDGDSELCKYTSDYVVNPNGWNDNKKIILTTDQDLIKDGVQAIDYEFLEWFVKNPSCKKVETKVVDFEVDMGLGDECIEHGSYYKIIIPQEKHTQETLEDAMNKDGYHESDYDKIWRQGVKFGASWQAERMFSEEDMKDYALKCVSTCLFNGDFISDNLRISIVKNNNKQFEQFKKK